MTKYIQGTLAGTLLLLVGAAASADVRIATHPGTACVPLQDVTSDLYYSGNGTAYNESTATYSVVCSADKMYIQDGSDDVLVDDTYWWASVEDTNTSTNATCYLRSCTQDGSSCVNSASRSTSGTGVQTLSTVGTVFAAGSYTNLVVLRCSLPGRVGSTRSGLLGFTTYEF